MTQEEIDQLASQQMKSAQGRHHAYPDSEEWESALSKLLESLKNMRMDQILLSKHPDMPGFTEAEKKELRKQG